MECLTCKNYRSSLAIYEENIRTINRRMSQSATLNQSDKGRLLASINRLQADTFRTKHRLKEHEATHTLD